MHDSVWFESQGVPAIPIISDGFTEAAATQAKTLGMPDLRYVVVQHPIQSRTDVEMHELADRAYPDILRALTE